MTRRGLSLRRTLGRLDLLSLRLFLAVCEEQHLGRAADREHITASAVTKRIQELEALFGVRLLHRSSRGVRPTVEGTALAARAHEVFAAVDRLRSDIGEFADGLRGRVRLHANTSALVEYLAADLRAFADAYPEIELEIQEQSSRDVEHAVVVGSADVGVLARTQPLDDVLESRPYRRDRLAVVMRAPREPLGAEAISFDQLLSLEIIGVQHSSAITMLLVNQAAAVGRAVRFRYRVATNEAARALVAAGFGVTVQPLGMVGGRSAECALREVPLCEAWAERELCVCFRRQSPLPRSARALVEFLGALAASP